MNHYIIALCLLIRMIYAQEEPWTWQYHKILQDTECSANRQRQELVFTKTGIPAFTQLLFSWNAYRPKSDHYSFYIQVRDTQSKKWGKWHKMIDWGNDIQKSYSTSSDGMSRYVHVRLETESSIKADAFKIKISTQRSDLSAMRSVTITASDLSRFAPERIMPAPFSSVHIPAVPKQSQLVLPHKKCRMMCSPTSCSMLIGYLTKKKINPLQFAQHSFDHGLNIYGSWPFNMAHAFELSDGNIQFYATRLHSFKNLHSKLTHGIPVVVSVRGQLMGAPKAYDNGHLLLVVGFDAKKRVVICHDPAELADHRTVKEYPMSSFIRAWERSRRLSYVADPMKLA